jgi:hypothetical protein
MNMRRVLQAGICFIFLISNAYSQTLSYRFSGTINYREGNSHGGFFNVGTPVTGWYSFNTNSPDFNPDPQTIQTYSVGSPYSFGIEINGIKFSTERVSMMFSNNNWGEDAYRVNSTQDPLTPSKYFQGLENVNTISGVLYLVDYSMTYYSGSQAYVQLTTPDLSEFNTQRVSLWGTLPGGGPTEFFTTAQINELYAVPEPGTILLLGLGAALLRRKK